VLTICTWRWGNKFKDSDIAKLERGLRRHVSQPFRFFLVEGDSIWDPGLTEIKGCFARLRMFDPEWQRAHGIDEGERIVCIDLDMVVTGELDPLFDRPETFCITQGGNASNPCPYNGCLQMLRAGSHANVWREFSLDAAMRVPFYSFPDDQGWLAAVMAGAAGWKIGPESGVYVYQKPGWPGYPDKTHTELPDGARLVTFINKHPNDVGHLEWVRRHWR
jgi:hypothetical protein